MTHSVVLKLGHGSWQLGFPGVMAQLWEADSPVPVQFMGELPPSAELPLLYNQWRSLYSALSNRVRRQLAIEIEADEVTNVSEAAFRRLCEQLQLQFNRWLESSSFSKVERQLRTRLLPTAEIRVIVETEDSQLRRFPWHLWQFFDDYPYAEVALSAPEYGRGASRRSPDGRVRLLAILGNSEGIDVQHDRRLLEQLPNAEVVFLVEPSRQLLHQRLWEEPGWDILFFAGHSTSQADGMSGELAINPSDSLTIAQLNHALKAAIAQGLTLAIFNSCDGLGLARSMADLNIPQLIVMREPVPDRVAQAFLNHLLTAFAGGKSLYRAVREAREKLQGLEDQFLCASWLPVLCQNPATVPLDWQGLRGGMPPVAPPAGEPLPVASKRRAPPRFGLKPGLVTGAIATAVVMGLRVLGMLQPLELLAFDQLTRMRPSEGGVDPRLLVVEVTQADTNQYGYPLSDQTLAQAIQILERAKPRAIGLDMHRYQPRGTGRAELIGQFQRHPNLFMVCSFGTSDRNYAPPPEFSQAQRLDQMGFSDVLVDSRPTVGGSMRYDLVSEGQQASPGDSVRRQLLSYDPKLAVAPSPCLTPYSLSFQLAFEFLWAAKVEPLEVNAQQQWQFGSVALQRLPVRFGGYQQLDGVTNQVMLNYRSDPPGAKVTLDQLLQGQVTPNLIADRVVLIGITAPVARDSFDTPYGEMAGIWIHAHMVSQLLSAVQNGRPLIWSLPQSSGIQWGDAVWVFAWSAAGALLAWRLRPLWLIAANAAATLALYQLCLVLLIQGGWLPLIPSLLALWLTSAGLFTLRAVNASSSTGS